MTEPPRGAAKGAGALVARDGGEDGVGRRVVVLRVADDELVADHR